MAVWKDPELFHVSQLLWLLSSG
uniref:Uncharacterized protein n=1 Tax=Rhizophora mucronata TaxID=61149 RepID=A0A2P2QQQ4_RHIMU